MITSFHSYSLTLADEKLDAIISFDSHVDDYFGGGERSLEAINELPFPERESFWRVCVHNLLRRSHALRDTPLYLVIPRGCFENRAYTDSMVMDGFGLQFSGSPVEARIDYLNRILGIRLFFCPPRKIEHLLDKVKKYHTALDVDIDYFDEFQEICYTKAPRMQDGNTLSRLGSLNDLFRTVRHVRPTFIIVSEVKLSQIKQPRPPFSQLLDFLKKQGYEIEYNELVGSDEMAESVIQKQKDFSLNFLNPLRNKLLAHSSQTSEEFIHSLEVADKEQANVIRRCFRRQASSNS